MGKITVKMPLEVIRFLKLEAKNNGIGIQNLAGQILVHGINDLLEKKKEHVDTKDKSR
jgi:hypothetical protein